MSPDTPHMSSDRPIIEVIQDATQRLNAAELYFGHGTDNATDEACWLICHALEWPVHEPLPERLLTADEQQKISQLIDQRIESRQPAAYLTGSTWFAGLPFQVNDQVLVPRSPLAELIVNQFEPWFAPEQLHKVLDLGTGSGCIAIACAHYLPHCQVRGSDISEDALNLAKINASANQVDGRCDWIKSDVFNAMADQHFDLIISNPPYVPDRRQQELADEYQAEPKLGLYSGADGLYHAAEILIAASGHLQPEGHLVLEIGESAETLQAQLPMIAFIWPEFEYGGEGVLIASRGLLMAHERDITDWYQARTGQQSPIGGQYLGEQN